MEFDDCWQRVKLVTSWKRYAQMVDFLKINKSTVSRKINEKVFPTDWALKIALGFNSNVHWILTGENPTGNQVVEEGSEKLDSFEEKLESFNPDADTYELDAFFEKFDENIEILDRVRFILKYGSAQDGVSLGKQIDTLFRKNLKKFKEK
jgi:hypothetical protein